MKNLAQRSSMRRSAGFTLIELLVVMGIIVTLASLILPAVNAAREEARRTQCLNHLKQVSAAAIAYETSHGAFPPGYQGPNPTGVVTASSINGSYQGLSSLAFLLTFLGKDALADRVSNEPLGPTQRNVNLDIDYPPRSDSVIPGLLWFRNTTGATYDVAKQKITEFLCPSAANQPPVDSAIVVIHGVATGADASATSAIQFEEVNTVDKTVLGVTNYLGVSGVHGLTRNPVIDLTSGILGNRSRTTKIRDGKSFTMLYGEATNLSGRKTYAWMGAGALPVCQRRKFVASPQIITNPNDPMLFSSHHRGGIVQFAFADGSCRPISMEIDQGEFEALAGANDGVPIDLSVIE